MGYPSDDLDVMARGLARLSEWIDLHNGHRDPEARTWGRIAKVGEEYGEVIEAMIALTGQNPRKPADGTVQSVIEELLDVAVTAMGTVEHLTGNQGNSMRMLRGKIRRVADRAGQ